MNHLFDLVYLVFEGRLKTQREFSENMFFSLGKINNLFREAVEKGYLIQDDFFYVSDKGMALLNDHKVDNAVIMAAGFGSRFVPMTYETPKGLLEVHGEVMIERQIKQLQEVGIRDITLVVGYLKESFEYLTDQFGVKLIYNPDYSVKNNISSIYWAQKELKNTYLLTSDIYMPENLYRKYEYNSFYAVEFFNGPTDEWALTLNKDNLILNANPSGGQDTWVMYGPVFLKQDFSENLVALVNHYYDDKSCAQWYWEDVYHNNMKALDLYARKYKSGSILEFESLEELRVYDSSYLTLSKSEILDIIMNVFDAKLSDIVNIAILKEGMTNDSFLFEVKGEKYVFRNPGKGTEFLINRKEERDVYDIVKQLKISDDVIYLNPEKGYKITKYIENTRTIDSSNPEEVEMALEKLRILHNSGLKTEHSFDIEERILFYYNLCLENNAILFNDFDKVFDDIKAVIKYLNDNPRKKVLAHIDSVAVNFLYNGEDVILLDWEYSGMADPLIDIAMYVVFDGLQDQEISDLLTEYLERPHTEVELLTVFSYVALAGFLWALWTQYKQACGEDFGTYGLEQYRYGRKYSRKVLSIIGENA